MKKRGFTIVELLIVIVVIAILAAISIVAYNGITVRAANAARLSELKAWQNHFEIYRAIQGELPNMANGGYCLGTGFPIGGGGVARCRSYQGTGSTSIVESDNATLMSELALAGQLPSGSRSPFGGSVIGPFVYYYDSYINISGAFQGSTESTCPDGTNFSWTDGSLVVLCYINITK